MMRTPPESIWKIVEQLHELKAGNFFWPNRSENAIVQLLKQLENANDPNLIQYITKFLSSPSREIHKVAIEAIGKLAANIPPCDLIDFADNFYWGQGYSLTRARPVQPADVARLSGSPSDIGYSGVLGVLSLHENGYVRHEALRGLSKIFDGSELQFLILRQNDWVQPIAHDAQHAVGQRINESYIQHWSRCLSLAVHLESLKRYDHRHTLQRVFDLLCSPGSGELLQSAVSSSDRQVRRRITKHVFDHPGEHQIRVLISASDSPDPFVRVPVASIYASLKTPVSS
jgi:HEAT repeat protein